MASLLLRRSGIAVGQVVEALRWRADVVYQVGVGHYHKETEVLGEEWPGVKFVGCEPHPQTYKDMRTKGHSDEYPGECHNVAVGDKVGETILYHKKRHKDGASLFLHHSRDENYQEHKVQITTLDALFPEPVPCRNLLWLDCEGNELAVLHGGEKFVESVDVVNVELASNPPCEGWCSPVDVHLWLVDHGFYRQWVHTQRIWAGQVDAVYVRKRLFKPQYCCCPCEVVRYEGIR